MARPDGPAVRRDVGDLGMLILIGTVLWRLSSTAWAIPLVVVQGYVLAFVFCALHETAHRTAFRTRWLNPVLGTLAGLLGFWPYRHYRVYHWDHHRLPLRADRDPQCHSSDRRHRAARVRPGGPTPDRALPPQAAHPRRACIRGR